MGQVLGNLLDNALRHTPPGGSVTVSADVQGDVQGDGRTDGRTDSRTDSRTDGWVRLQVRDTGVGVAPEHLPHLFERFYRVDAARDRGRGGSGIGLAIVKALAEAHGGRVDAASDGPGTGATFTVTLPPVR
jgi:signal transduction histidine kinase